MRLKSDSELEDSAIVANCTMNRERRAFGGNSYQRDLGFCPVAYLRERASLQPEVTWVDLCCGTGLALIESAEYLYTVSPETRWNLIGVDLVDWFAARPPGLPGLRFETASVSGWAFPAACDLITCVHGLHYVGDKLAVLTAAAAALAPEGRFLAHLDPSNLRAENGAPLSRPILRQLRSAGAAYDARRHRVTCTGPRSLSFPYEYLGADDTAGPNYTGQPAVHSVYRSLGSNGPRLRRE